MDRNQRINKRYAHFLKLNMRLFHSKSRILSVALALCLVLPAGAMAQLIPVLGSQRAGTAMYPFLKIGVGARAVGMGEAFVAVANDASALYWNPAGITQVKRNELTFSHVNWPVEVQHEFVGYVHKLGRASFLGLSVTSLHTDDMEETTEFQPLGTGNFFSFSDIALALTFSRQMTDKFSVGATVKYVDETLSELHARNVLFDFGTSYWTGFGSTRFAVSVLNFGTNIEPAGTLTYRDGSRTTSFQDFAPPTIFRIGFAAELVDNERSRLTTSIQLNHPNDNAENVAIGAEYAWGKWLVVRGGYLINMDEASVTAGAGLAIPVHHYLLTLDAAYTDFGRLGTANRLSVNLKF